LPKEDFISPKELQKKTMQVQREKQITNAKAENESFQRRLRELPESLRQRAEQGYFSFLIMRCFGSKQWFHNAPIRDTTDWIDWAVMQKLYQYLKKHHFSVKIERSHCWETGIYRWELIVSWN